jgi:hypothetical protein
MRSTLLLALSLLPASAAAQDFWAHWGDGRAELNGYRTVQPRYGAPRHGTQVLIFVTEDMSERLRVKVEERSKHEDAFPVMKLNTIEDFRTGIYDYNVMTSTFCRAAPGWPVAKISFSSQDWCGHVYHQLLPRSGRVAGSHHSYFEGEADGTEDLPLPEDGVFEDALPVLLRGWLGEYLAAGESRAVPLLPRLFRSRLQHRPLAWERARIERSAATSEVRVPAGTFRVWTWRVETAGGATTTFEIEADPPYRLVRRTGSGGERAELLGSTRLAYWKLNAPGGEVHLRELGLEGP